MSQRSLRSREKLHNARNTTPLSIEQLEARMMNAIGSIEGNIQALLGPSIVSTTTNTAPRIASSVRLNGSTVVTGQTASVSVLGSDNAGEANLTYTWQATNVPAGATVTFASNGTNASKNNTLSFDRAGSYSISVRVQDSQGLTTTSSLRFSVLQTLTTMEVKTLDGTAVQNGDTLTSTSNQQRLTVVGYDQFGQSIRNVSVRWTQISSPSGGTSTFSISNSTLTGRVNKSGTYGWRAESGGLSLNLSVNVVSTLTSLRFVRTDGTELRSTGANRVDGASLAVQSRGFDQFGTLMATTPTVNWSASSKPDGSTFSSSSSNGVTTLRFSSLGAFSLQASSGSVTSTLSVNVTPTVSGLKFFTTDDQEISTGTPISTSMRSTQLKVRGVDQFGNALSTVGAIAWVSTAVPSSGVVSARLSSGVTTLGFNRAGTYSLTARIGNTSASIQVQVAQTLTSLTAIDGSGVPYSASKVIKVTTVSQQLSVQGRDQFGQAMVTQPAFSWSTVSAPQGTTVNIQSSNGTATATFQKSGVYGLRASTGGFQLDFSLSVAQTLTTLRVTPGSASFETGASQQFQVQALDQFGVALSTQPTVTWATTSGRISREGLLVAGATAGTFAVSASSGSISGSVNFQLTAAFVPNGLNNRALSTAVSQANTDGLINRTEMIGILRTAGLDGVVDATEFSDLQNLVATTSTFVMPTFVRDLARDVINGNVANRMYKGQAAGNLAAGSSSTLLNNLVDKWFLGTDDPALSSSSYRYTVSTGNLFNATPSRADAKQGMLGDCYFIAALVAIADKNPDAVRNMFVDNGDGTYTVRFFQGSTADYVTVSRKLATYSNGTLVYSGYGLSALNASTSIWIALAEKAYAQWNETGKAGRDGTNRFAAIEGGWMSTVNAQVLGYNSTNFAFAGNNKQNLIDSLNAGRSVTLGTLGSVNAGGLYGSHAYIVTGYNSANDTFTLHNPWGFAHPTPLTWAQLQSNCSFFVVTTPTTTGTFASVVRTSVPEVVVGNWTTVSNSGEGLSYGESSEQRGVLASDQGSPLEIPTVELVETEIEVIVENEDVYSEEEALESIYASVVDLLMADAAFSLEQI